MDNEELLDIVDLYREALESIGLVVYLNDDSECYVTVCDERDGTSDHVLSDTARHYIESKVQTAIEMWWYKNKTSEPRICPMQPYNPKSPWYACGYINDTKLKAMLDWYNDTLIEPYKT